MKNEWKANNKLSYYKLSNKMIEIVVKEQINETFYIFSILPILLARSYIRDF